MQNIGVNFKIGTEGNAGQALKNLAQDAVKAAAAEKQLLDIEERRRKASRDDAQQQHTQAQTNAYFNPTKQNVSALGKAADRVQKLKDDEELRVATEARNSARRNAAYSKTAAEKAEREERAAPAKAEAAKKKIEAEKAKALKAEGDVANARTALFAKSLAFMNMGAAGQAYGSIGAVGESLSMAGMKGAGGLVSRAAGPIAAGMATGEMLAKVAKVQNDEYLTSSERSKSFWNDMPVTGWFNRIDNETSGKSRNLERAGETMQTDEAVRGVRQRERQATLAYNNRQDAADARVGATAGATALGGATADRSSAAGRLAYKEQMALLPLQEEGAKAEREAAAAKMTSVKAAERQRDLEKDGVELMKKRAILGKEELNPANQSGANRVAILAGRDRVEKDIAANLEAQRGQAEVVAGTGAASATANSDARKRQIAIEQGKLSLLESRESSASDAQANLGMMGVGGRMSAKMALQMANTVGLDAMSPEMIQQAASIAPKTIRAMAEKTGGRDNAEMRRLAPGDADLYQDLGEARGAVDKQGQKVRDAKVADEKETAADMAKSLAPMKKALETFANEVTATINMRTTDLKLQRAQKIP